MLVIIVFGILFYGDCISVPHAAGPPKPLLLRGPQMSWAALRETKVWLGFHQAAGRKVESFRESFLQFLTFVLLCGLIEKNRRSTLEKTWGPGSHFSVTWSRECVCSRETVAPLTRDKNAALLLKDTTVVLTKKKNQNEAKLPILSTIMHIPHCYFVSFVYKHLIFIYKKIYIFLP